MSLVWFWKQWYVADEKHGSDQHGIFHCEKCEYSADDKSILNKHMMGHTGRIICTCNPCEFEATRESIVENHQERKHKKVVDAHLPQKCKDCERFFSKWILTGTSLLLSRIQICMQ